MCLFTNYDSPEHTITLNEATGPMQQCKIADYMTVLCIYQVQSEKNFFLKKLYVLIYASPI